MLVGCVRATFMSAIASVAPHSMQSRATGGRSRSGTALHPRPGSLDHVELRLDLRKSAELHVELPAQLGDHHAALVDHRDELLQLRVIAHRRDASRRRASLPTCALRHTGVTLAHPKLRNTLEYLVLARIRSMHSSRTCAPDPLPAAARNLS